MLKRFFDFTLSLLGIIILSPFFLVIAIIVKIDSKGPILYRQLRVGKDNKDFYVLKFRSMKVNSDKESLLTVGKRDLRITRAGYFLRKYKLDELPQLLNVMKGDMSFVGPRPEVRKYVEMYNDEQKRVLLVRPGITDVASIIYKDENELLMKADDPEEFYINKAMPDKLRLNLDYISVSSFSKDIKIILRTLKAIWN